MVQEKKNKQPFPYKNQPVNIILNKTKQQQQKKTQNKYIIKKQIHTVTFAYSCLAYPCLALNNQNQNL